MGNSSGGVFALAKDLLLLFFDDESMVLALLPSPVPLMHCLRGQPVVALQSMGSAAAGPAACCASRTSGKVEPLVSYCHVFRVLNEATLVDPTRHHPDTNDSDGGRGGGGSGGGTGGGV